MRTLLEDDDVEAVLLVDDRTPSEHPCFMSNHSTNAWHPSDIVYQRGMGTFSKCRFPKAGRVNRHEAQPSL